MLGIASVCCILTVLVGQTIAQNDNFTVDNDQILTELETYFNSSEFLNALANLTDLLGNVTDLDQVLANFTDSWNTIFNSSIMQFVTDIFTRGNNCTDDQRTELSECGALLSNVSDLISNTTQQITMLFGMENSSVPTLPPLTAANIERLTEDIKQMCLTRTTYLQCASAAIQNTECQPIDYRILKALLEVTCQDDFKAAMTDTTANQCLVQAVKTPEVVGCLSTEVNNGGVAMQNFLFGQFGQLACSTVGQAFDCVRQPAANCRSKLVTVGEALISTIFDAVFGQKCQFEQGCEREAVKYLENGQTGSPPPQCQSDGTYAPQQCQNSTNTCYCVDSETGTKLPMTDTPSGIQFLCQGEFGILWSQQNCTAPELLQAQQCQPLIEVGFENFKNITDKLTEITDFANFDVVGAVTQFKATCNAYRDYDGCVNVLSSNSTCQPYVHHVLSTVFETVCSSKFAALILKETPCLAKVFNDPKTKLCQQNLQQTIADARDLGLWQNLDFPVVCLQVQSSLGCMKQTLAKGDCGEGLITTLDRLAHDTIAVLLGPACG